MKPILILFVSTLIISNMVFAQGNKSVFLELGGNGLGFSANFDSRFTKAEKGLGFRAGVGIFPGAKAGDNGITLFSWPTIVSIPVGLNYLAGKAPNYLEAGLGASYFHAKGNFTFFFIGTEGTLNTVVFVPSIGYRYARLGKSFQGRIFISPYVGSGGASFYGGVSAGFKF